MNPVKMLLPSGRAPRVVQSGLFAGLRLNLDLRHGEAQVWLGLYEREIFGEIRRLAHDCRAAIDLGAAKGDLTLWLLRQPGMERVVAVEPLDRERAQLRDNLALNGLEHDQRLHLHPGFAGRGPHPEWRTLDELAEGLSSPIFIKIDIDGPEAEVLDTGQTTLAGDCQLLIETHSLEAERGCIARLTALGYQTKITNPAWWRAILPERRPIAHNRWLSAWRPSAAAASALRATNQS